MSSTFTPSNTVDLSKEREWSAALGMLDWDSTSIVFTKRSLIEFLKYTGTTVDTNFNNISKLPRYAKFGKLSAAPEGGASTESAAQGSAEESSGASEGFKPSRRVRDPPGGVSSLFHASEAETDDALSQAPPKPADQSVEQTQAIEKPTKSTEPEEEYGLDFSSGFKPTRRVRERPGGKDSISSVFGSDETVEEFKPTRRVREIPGGRDNINGLF